MSKKPYVFQLTITDEQATSLIVAVDGYLHSLRKSLGDEEVSGAHPDSCVGKCLAVQAALRDAQHGRCNDTIKLVWTERAA